MRLLSSEREGLGVNEIARRTDLVPSTCYHILRALVDEGFVRLDHERKTYSTGVGLLTLLKDALANNEFPKIVQPILEKLADDHGVTTVAVELESQRRMVVVALARSASMISLHASIGSRFPAFISATGRCVAAQSGLSKTALKREFEMLEWECPPKFEDWYSELEKIRRENVAVDSGHYIKGVSVVATLIPSASGPSTRGIAAIGIDHQLNKKVITKLKSSLVSAAKETATQIQ